MLLQDRILALLAQHPGASSTDIRAALPDAKLRSIASAIRRLRDRGQIEPVGWGAYRLARKIEQQKPPTEINGYIRAPLSRLMSGR